MSPANFQLQILNPHFQELGAIENPQLGVCHLQFSCNYADEIFYGIAVIGSRLLFKHSIAA